MLYLNEPNENNSIYPFNEDCHLSDELIFVFGSNRKGIHGKGTALYAKQFKGAIQGVGSGLMGRSYAIPTNEDPYRTLSVQDIKKYVDDFVNITNETNLKFYLTPIGTGLAGFKDEQIAPMFKGIKNCWVPDKWAKYILK